MAGTAKISNNRKSNGMPFTVEDFRYYYEDEVNNLDLSRSRAFAL